jgi:hypothetical protein
MVLDTDEYTYMPTTHLKYYRCWDGLLINFYCGGIIMKKGNISWAEFDEKLYEIFGKKMKSADDLYFNLIKQVEIGESTYLEDMDALNCLQDLQEMEGELCVIPDYCYDYKCGPFIVNANEIHDFVEEFLDEYGQVFHTGGDLIIINFEKKLIWVLFHEGICWLTKGRIDCAEEDQAMFFHELRRIQMNAIYDCMSNLEKYKSQVDILKDVTFDVIVMIMELLDGYENELIKCNVTNIKTGNTLNSDIEMQDMCADVLACSDI